MDQLSEMPLGQDAQQMFLPLDCPVNTIWAVMWLSGWDWEDTIEDILLRHKIFMEVSLSESALGQDIACLLWYNGIHVAHKVFQDPTNHAVIASLKLSENQKRCSWVIQLFHLPPKLAKQIFTSKLHKSHKEDHNPSAPPTGLPATCCSHWSCRASPAISND